MPRRSLPASTVTPKRSSAPQRSQTSLKRSTRQNVTTPESTSKRRRGNRVNKLIDDDDDVEEKVNGDEEVNVKAEDGSLDPEKELEAWQELIADYHEMVEQLPLELHRNFRLLRELDDTCQAQTKELLNTIKTYIHHRLGTVGTNDTDLQAEKPGQPSPPVVQETNDDTQKAEDMGVPVPDGEGGLLLPAENGDADGASEVVETVEERRPFPEETIAEDPEMQPNGGFAEENSPAAEDGTGEAEPVQVSSPERQSVSQKFLPEIGRLAREMVRNGEEKVALAVGAYNAIDRHIRALDSALSSHEANILLGLRMDTNPSSAVADAIVLDGGAGAKVDDGYGEVTIGMGGGGRRKKNQKGKKKGQEVPAAVNEAPLFEDVDPNEPRYCYCNQVSYGPMIGCENDECPMEWFHLGCTGLTAPPVGKWWCNVCRPKAVPDRTGGPKAQGKGKVRHAGHHRKK